MANKRFGSKGDGEKMGMDFLHDFELGSSRNCYSRDLQLDTTFSLG